MFSKLFIGMAISFISSLGISAARDVNNYDQSWYQAASWPGEYPSGVVTTKYVDTLGRSEPKMSAIENVRCELPSGLLIHLWSKNEKSRKSDFVYWSKIVKYKALVDITTSENLTIKAGDIVEELAYGSEGYCMVRYQGKETFESCPGNGGNENQYERLPDQLDAHELWIGLQCLGGKKAYFLMESEDGENLESANSQLIEKTKKSGLVISREMIQGYGEVKEDQIVTTALVKEAAITEVLNQDSLTGKVLTNYAALGMKNIPRLGFEVTVVRRDNGEARATKVKVSYRGKVL